LLILIIQSLYGVDVLFGLIGNAAEDIDEAIYKRATCVVMSSLIKLRQVKPDVNVGVVALCLQLGTLIFFP
jgi:hypothetical protein